MSLRGWALFAAMSVAWGVPYLFIKIAVDDGLSPGFVAWSRVALGALVLLPVALRSGALRGLPLRFDRSERPTRTRLLGMLVGLGGVAALVGIDIGGTGSELIGAGAILVATMGYACGPLIVNRQLSDADPLGPVTAAMAIASIILLPFGIGDFPSQTPSGEAILAVVVLGLVCSATAFLVFFRLIAEVGPSRATVITYVNPVVALALGVAVLGESITAGAVAGLLLILAGSWLATDGRLPPGLAALGHRLSGRKREPGEAQLQETR